MAEYQILSWKGIPAQIKVFGKGTRPISRQLPHHFLLRIDATAMKEGLTGTEEYLNQWHWSARQHRDGSAEEVAEAVIKELTEQNGPDA